MSTGTFYKKAYCHQCRKNLDDEFVPSHQDLKHRVEYYVYGGYKGQEKEVAKVEPSAKPDEHIWQNNDEVLPF